MRACCVVFVVCITSFAIPARIIFPTGITTRTDGCYLPQHNREGICSPPQDCKLFNELRKHSRYGDILCSTGDSSQICCPENLDVVPAKLIDISKPTSTYEGCGSIFYNDAGSLHSFYKVNNSADNFQKEGFTITEYEMEYEDKLSNFRFSNATFSDTYKNYIFEKFRLRTFVYGGLDARRVVTVYMALLGERHSKTDGVDWWCDGVLINFEWVLTAAHCFTENINAVRLGEYNLTSNKDYSDPQDYEIKKVVLYPKYKFPAAYHDLALVQLSRRTYVARKDINPICLPWGQQAQIPLVDKQITLTGWGATFYGGPTTDVPQEVNVTVFHASKCEKGYSTLRDYAQKFPSGILGNNAPPILCAGDESGGKDACQGDSGGPVVYINNEEKYTLAGIVATGHGCGIKDFPGIYTPIAVPEYLNWIKTTAFPPDGSDLLA